MYPCRTAFCSRQDPVQADHLLSLLCKIIFHCCTDAKRDSPRQPGVTHFGCDELKRVCMRAGQGAYIWAGVVVVRLVAVVGQLGNAIMTEVRAFGSNGNWQLGLGHADDTIVPQTALVLPAGKAVKRVACGGNHSMLLLESGELYGCGSNASGQLCDDLSVKAVPSWERVVSPGDDVLAACVDIACGWEFSVVLDSHNGVWSRGSGPKGELGLGEDVVRSDSWHKVMDAPRDAHVKLQTSFENCVVVVTDANGASSIAYGFGSNTKCQLGQPKAKRVDTPAVVYRSDSHSISTAAMGKNFIVLVDSTGSIVHTSGAIPQSFDLTEWSQRSGLDVQAMWSSIYVLYEGRIYSYGFGVHGQIFDNDYYQEKILGKHENAHICQWTTGSEHGIMVVQSADVPGYSVYCWGWGEHGNCGRVDSDANVADTSIINDYSNLTSKLNRVFVSDSNVPPRVFGGCASTWIVEYK